MANPDQIEQELRAYLDEERNLSKADRMKYLMAIFNKHFGMDQTEHLLNDHDLHDIISYAKSSYARTTLPMRISKKEIHPSDVNFVLMIEAVVGHFNKSKLLKKLIKFDFTR
jgi:hypothetical protein